MRRSSATSRQDRMGKAHRRQKSSGSTGYQFGYRLALQKSSCSCRQEKQLPNSSRPLIPAQCPILCRTGGERELRQSCMGPEQWDSAWHTNPPWPSQTAAKALTDCSLPALASLLSGLHFVFLLREAISMHCVLQNYFKCFLQPALQESGFLHTFSTDLLRVLNALTGPHDCCLAFAVWWFCPKHVCCQKCRTGAHSLYACFRLNFSDHSWVIFCYKVGLEVFHALDWKVLFFFFSLAGDMYTV